MGHNRGKLLLKPTQDSDQMADSASNSMQWVSALSTRPSLEAAVNEVVTSAQAALAAPADLGLVFISSTFASEYPRLLPLLNERLNVPALIGCGGGGIIGNAAAEPDAVLEMEDEPALVLCLAHLPGVSVQPFWLDEDKLPDLDSSPESWTQYVGVDPQDNPDFILIADPFTSKITDLLQGMDFAYPTACKIGGMASGGTAERANGLFFNQQYYEEGTIGVALSGRISICPVVSQGCRPVGPVFRVVEGQRNVILKLETDAGQAADASPLEALQKLLRDLTESEREIAQRALFVGVAYSGFPDSLEQGDFLIRSLVGIDPRAGAIAIGDRVRPGQRIQFHLRDADTAAEDLERLLKRHCEQMDEEQPPVGGLMFSCLGRGEDLYNEQNFDSGLLRKYIRTLPLSGFFCDGEIGPIGGSTYLHGYTSVFGLIYEE